MGYSTSPISWDSFAYNGTDVYSLAKLKIIKYDVLMPTLRERFLIAPKVSGSIRQESHWHDDRILRMQCTIEGDVTEEQMDDLKYLLSSEGRITVWDKPDRYLIGQCFDAAEVLEYYRRCMQDFELNFKCYPYWYYQTPTERKTSDDILWFNDKNDGIPYLGTREAPTRITIRNTGTTPISGIKLILRKTSS